MSRKPVHLVLVEEKSVDGVDHNKFYDMFEINGELHCRWGRRQNGYEFGKSGRLTEYSIDMWYRVYDEKIGKGYQDFSHLYEEVITDKAIVNDEHRPIEDKDIDDLVKRLRQYARDVIAANYSVKSAQVTNRMVQEAQLCIDRMIICDDVERFNTHYKELLKIIPRSISRVDLILAKSRSDMDEIIIHEQDLLDIMKGQIDTVGGLDDSTDSDTEGREKTVLEANNIDLCPIDEKDRALILKKLGRNKDKFKNAWKIIHPSRKGTYEAYLKNEGIRRKDTKLLWHGSRNENIWNILKGGLVLNPVNAIRTGSMFGYGIYFAPQSSKSMGYTSINGSYWARGRANNGFLILHEVAYGNPYDVDSFKPELNTFTYEKLRKKSDKYHCLHAHSGKGMLRNDEIVVYRDDQVSALYLVEIE